MASRKLEDLHPGFREKVARLLEYCARLDIPILVVCTYRSPEEQNELYQRGRDADGNIVDKKKIVTYSRGGQSAHNHKIGRTPAALAVDIAFGDRSHVTWKGPWRTVGGIGVELCKVEWGGDWKGFKDKGHFQERKWRQITKEPH